MSKNEDVEINKFEPDNKNIKTVEYETSEMIEEGEDHIDELDEELETYKWIEMLSKTLSDMKVYSYENGLDIGEYLSQKSLYDFMGTL